MIVTLDDDSNKSVNIIWALSSEFVSSSIPSWQILTAHAQPFGGARDLAFCFLAWTFAARIGDKYQIRFTQPISLYFQLFEYEENPLKKTNFRDDSDTDDDASSCFHDDDEPESSEDEGEETQKKTLEWDDSTMSY